MGANVRDGGREVSESVFAGRSLIDLSLLSSHAGGVVYRAFFALFLLLSLDLSAEVEEDLTLGIESVTGLRSGYVSRGFALADAVLEAQVETEVALGDDSFLGIAAWHVAESSGAFAETALGLSLARDFENLRLTASLDYHSFSESVFRDGFDLGVQAQWFFGDDWDLGAKAHYDFAAQGSYFALEGGWSRPLSEDLYLAAESGVSAVSDYYERSGANDFYGRLSLTYNVNSFLSLTPFVGYSLGLADDSNNETYAGLWLAVSF